MKIDLSSSEKWERVNQHFGANARVYKGMAEAIYELTVGTALFLRHKRSVCFIQGVSPVFQVALPFFYKETYQVHLPKISQIVSAADFVEQLPKDCVFVAMVEDHPVTGEIYPIIDEIDVLLSQKRILFLRISHSLFWHQEMQLNPYSVRLCSVEQDFAVAYFGEKFKVPAVFSSFVSFNEIAIIERYKYLKAQVCTAEVQIREFEKEIQTIGAESILTSANNRLFDRAVVNFCGVNGENFITRLKLNTNEADTTNQCRWDAVNMFNQWWENSPSPDVLRGLVTFSARYISDRSNWEKIKLVYQDLLLEQKW